jgi:hypothetical protein
VAKAPRRPGWSSSAGRSSTVLVEQVAELLGMDAEDVDPRYPPDD